MRLFDLPPQRKRRHRILALAALLAAAGLFALFGLSTETWVDIPGLKAHSLKWRLSVSLAYTALLFLAAALAIGPLNVLRKRPLPANDMLRRDVAIWAGFLGLAHMSVGMLVHTGDLQLWRLFFWSLPHKHDLLPLRKDLFSLANFAGLAQASILILLLALSNNIALRRLGTRRWKNLQRLSYVAVALIALHGTAYQLVERRDALVRAAFIGILLAVALLQLTGLAWRLSRRRDPKREDALDGEQSLISSLE